MLNVLTDATTGSTMVDFSSFDFSSLVPTFMSGVAAVMGVVIGFIAVKKAIAWVLGAIKRA